MWAWQETDNNCHHVIIIKKKNNKGSQIKIIRQKLNVLFSVIWYKRILGIEISYACTFCQALSTTTKEKKVEKYLIFQNDVEADRIKRMLRQKKKLILKSHEACPNGYDTSKK